MRTITTIGLDIAKSVGSASFFKFCAVSGVYGTYSARMPRLIFLHRLMRAADDIGRGERFDVADLMEQVRTQ